MAYWHARGWQHASTSLSLVSHVVQSLPIHDTMHIAFADQGVRMGSGSGS
jgi:hypothetical protein